MTNPTKDSISSNRLKISSAGWLCIFDQGEWLAVVKLTDAQVQAYRETIRHLVALEKKPHDQQK